MTFTTTAKFTIPIEALMSYESDGYCYWGFTHIGNGTEFVIGEIFFEQFYTIFDNKNSKMGFGVSVNGIYDATITDAPETVPQAPNAPKTYYDG